MSVYVNQEINFRSKQWWLLPTLISGVDDVKFKDDDVEKLVLLRKTLHIVKRGYIKLIYRSFEVSRSSL